MKVIILGAAGFLGRKLTTALIDAGQVDGKAITALTLADVVAPDAPEAAFPVETSTIDIADKAQVSALIGKGADLIYHLAAIVSGEAELDFEKGLNINLFGTLHVLEAARALGTCPRVVYTSSCAVYGGEIPTPIEDWTHLNPQTSYGAQKAMGEFLVTDYSRKGFIDGRGLRLPTITVRAGKANKAASSFMSSVFREPLQGDPAICPVEPDLGIWWLSPRRCIDNLVHAAEIPAEDWGMNRCLCLPGQSSTIGEMIEAMRRVAGDAPVDLIEWRKDPFIEKIATGWPVFVNTQKALRLGFKRDDSFEDNIRYFLEDDIQRKA